LALRGSRNIVRVVKSKNYYGLEMLQWGTKNAFRILVWKHVLNHQIGRLRR